MSDELARLDATAQADLVRSGEASPAELAEAAIARVEATNPEVNAVIHPAPSKGCPSCSRTSARPLRASRCTSACAT
jgi:Asp-tRNA(Asn)/Glu-tRNA(Gln) amidotransferase A subunit family amidase